MIRRRLPAAAVLGACAIALTVGVLPAHAVDRSIPIGTGSIPITAPTLVVPSTGTATGKTASTGDGSTATTGSTSSGDSSKSADADPSDSGDLLAGDGSSSDSQAGSEAGPVVRLDASSITPAELSWKGLKVVASGLTPNTRYQPYARLGSTSIPIGPARTADVWGWMTFTWKPKDSVPTGVRSIGVGGLQGQTDGVEQQLTVKYDSGLSWHASKRHGDAVTLAIAVNRASAGERYSAWTGVEVLVQKRTGGRWRTVRTVTASAKGIAKATIVSPTAQWRAKVAETATVFGVVSSTHRRKGSRSDRSAPPDRVGRRPVADDRGRLGSDLARGEAGAVVQCGSDRVLQLLDLLRAQLDVGRLHVVLEVRDGGGARDRDHHR